MAGDADQGRHEGTGKDTEVVKSLRRASTGSAASSLTIMLRRKRSAIGQYGSATPYERQRAFNQSIPAQARRRSATPTSRRTSRRRVADDGDDLGARTRGHAPECLAQTRDLRRPTEERGTRARRGRIAGRRSAVAR